MKRVYYALSLMALITISTSCQKDNITDSGADQGSSTLPTGGLVVNETASSDDFVEIYNGSLESVDLSGYVVNDSNASDESAYVFAEGTTIESGGFIALYKDVDFLFGISGNGETIYLMDSELSVVSTLELPAEEAGYQSYGRVEDGGEECQWFEYRTDGLSNTTIVEPSDDGELYPDWSTETHSNDVEPNFSVVFAQDRVHRIDVTIAPSDWDAMWEDLAQNIRGGMPDNSTTDFTPIWVQSTITYQGLDWYNVGVRFKGNSSLSSSYQSNIDKLSLKLDFDEWEDDYPALKNQRFYGFKQLNLNNNYLDQSFMREKVASDLFRDFGLAAANTSFCEVYIDHGSGPVYYGLYTIVEEVDDTVIETQFSDDSGNLYKPDGDAATFGYGTYDIDEFYPKSNEETTDYSDLRALYDALHSPLRTTDQEAWKDELESIFSVDGFMKWLAANLTIQNWDTYGSMSHNYYLYNNPQNGLLTWIPWDNNEAFQDGHGNRQAYDPDELWRVSDSWPLISYLIEVEEYKAIFDGHLSDFIERVFTYESLSAKYAELFTLIQESAYSEESNRTFLSSDGDFDRAVDVLVSHIAARISEVESYLY